jgi:hypothetical protein
MAWCQYNRYLTVLIMYPSFFTATPEKDFGFALKKGQSIGRPLME